MGTGATPVSSLPPLPAGATLNTPPPAGAALPPLPPGAAMNSAPAQQPQAPAPAQQPAQHSGSLLDRINSAFEAHPAPAALQAVGDVGTGLLKGAGQTLAGLLEFANSGAEHSRRATAAQQYQQANPNATPQQVMDAAGIPTGSYTTLPTPADPQVAQQLQVARDHDHVRNAAQWLRSKSHPDGLWQHIGDLGENVAELLGTEGLAELGKGAEGVDAAGKVPGIVDELRNSQQVAQFLQKYPKLAGLVTLGMHTARAATKAAAQAGAQTFVKTGGDTGQAAEAALLGGAGGAVVEPIAMGASKLVSHIAPTVEKIGGEDTPILRSQSNAMGANGVPEKPSMLQVASATTDTSPDVVGQQQAAADRTVRTEAQNVLQRELGAVNESRAPRAQAPGARTSQQAAGETAPLESANVRLESGSPELPSQTAGRDPRLGNGSDLAPRETGLAEAEAPQSGSNPNAAAPQPGQAQLPAPEPYSLKAIDVQHALASTENFGDAADHLHEAGRQVYDRLNDITGGQWQNVDARIQKLQSRYQQSYGAEHDQIGQELGSLRGRMDSFFNLPGTGISSDALSGAKRAWRAGYQLRDLHNALEPAYQVDADYAKRTGEYRGFNGSLALNRLRSQLRTNPGLKDTLGTQTTDNLQRIFRYNTTMAGRKRFGEGVSGLARWMAERGGKHLGLLTPAAGLGYALGGAEGAALAGTGAEALYGATRFVLHKIATDPRIGKSFMFALDSGARPENYTATIGEQIARGVGRTVRASRNNVLIPATAGKTVRAVNGDQPQQETQQ